jgi:hypothetical protein
MARERELEQSNYFLYLYLCLYLCQAVLREVMQPAAGPNQVEDCGNPWLVLVLVLVQMQGQVEVQVQQRAVSLTVGVVN